MLTRISLWLCTLLALGSLTIPPAAAIDGDYVVGSYVLRDLGLPELPDYTASLTPRVDDTPHDADGVRLFQDAEGRLYDHPVRQASYGLANLNSYRASGDAFYLDRAIAQADRLVETAVHRDGAWFFPYPFDFDLHGVEAWRLTAPWYSGMAQGEALRLFVRLADATGDPAWDDAADATFRSFTLDREAGLPWVSVVDDERYLWFEEYAEDDHLNQTFNGHMFAVYGLFEYQQHTGDALAARLTRAGLATVEHYAPRIRVPGKISLYCLQHRVWSRKYHTVHISMLLQLYRFTGSSVFAEDAETFTHDYPFQDKSGRVVFEAGKHPLIQVDKDGAVTKRATLSLRAVSSAEASARVTLPSQPGVYYRLSTGTFAGWYVRESADAAIRGAYDALDYMLPRRVVIRAGIHTGVQFGSAWRESAKREAAVSRASVAHASRRAWVNGVERVLLTNGIWAGYWLPASAVV